MKLNRDTILRNGFTILALVLILVIEGCFNFLTIKWSWNVLMTVIFWVGVVTRITLMLLTRSAALTTFIPIDKRKNQDLAKEMITNERLMKLKDKGFPSWVENILNRIIRKKAWNEQINKKLARLEKKAKYTDRALYLKEDSAYAESKKNNKYCIKKAEYLSLLDEKYVDKNIDILPVKKCTHVDPALFDLPVTNVSNTDQYQLVAKTKQAILWTLVAAGLSMTVSTTIKNALQFGYSKEELITALVSMLVDVFFLCWQLIRGITDSYKIVNDQEVVPYANRNRILIEYLDYKTPDEEKTALYKMLEQFKEPKKEKNEKIDKAKEIIHDVTGKVAPYIIK